MAGGYKQSWAIFTQWSGRPLSEGGGAKVTKLLAMGFIGLCCQGEGMASIERIEEGEGVITVYFSSPYTVQLQEVSPQPQLRSGQCPVARSANYTTYDENTPPVTLPTVIAITASFCCHCIAIQQLQQLLLYCQDTIEIDNGVIHNAKLAESFLF